MTAAAQDERLVVSRERLLWLARGATLALILQSAGGGFGYVLQVLLAHWMGTDEFGAYAYATTWATALSLFTGLGFQTAVIRFVPLYATAHDNERFAGVVRVGRMLSLLASIVFAGIGTAVAFALSDHLIAGLAPTILGLWLIPALSLAEFDAAVARAQGRVVKAYAPWYVVRPLATVVVLGLLFVAGAQRDATTALTATLIIFVGTWVLQKWLVDRTLPVEVKRAAPRRETSEWLRTALPLLLVGGFQLALTQTDILVVGALGGRRDAALYTAASKTALLVGYLLLAISFVAAPLFPPLVSAGRRRELQRLISTSTRWVFWLSLLIGGALVLLSPFILRLFGSDFAPARTPMIILIGGQILNAAFASVGYLLSLTGYQRDAARAYGAVAGMNVALCIAGAAMFGMAGAATATVISLAVWNIWLHSLAVRRLGIHTSIFYLPRVTDVDSLPPFVPSPLPRVAVVIPCFNDGAHVGQAVASVKAQEDCELIVVDDGSTDPDTLQVLKTLEREGARVIRQQNAGPGPARTNGMRHTTAPYVFPLDADDLLAQDALSTLADWLDAHPDLDVVWGRYRYVGERTHVKDVGQELDPWVVSYLNDLPSSALFRRSTLERAGAWRGSDFHEDWDLWMTLAEAGAKGRGLEDVIYYHRLHGIRRGDSAIPFYGVLRETLRQRHPLLYSRRHENRQRSSAPVLAKLLIPLTETIRIGSPYRRAFLAAAIWHAAHRRGGYDRPVRRLLRRIVLKIRRPSPALGGEGGA